MFFKIGVLKDFAISIKIWRLILKKNFVRKKMVVYVLNYLKTFKAVHKNNPRTHSQAVLMTAAYFKVSTPVMSQGQ